jgi:hypothetical protein
VQAAHEILSNPEQKRKYDLDRARLKANAPTIPRRGPVPPTPSAFPPPPRRAASTASRQNPFAGSTNTPRARQAPPPANAEKYAPYARAGAQQWEKTKEEAQSKADALRGFQQMKPGQSPTAERFPPPPPPPPLRQGRYPTAPRPTSYAPKSAGPTPSTEPRLQRSWDEFNKAARFTSGAESSAGFPGLSRTQSTWKKQGYTPTIPGGEELPAPRSSAHASYSRGERPQASTAQSYFPEGSAKLSPQMTPQKPSASPLRHARSSGGIGDERRAQRPSLGRGSSRYSGIGGERTDITSSGIGRSSSVRNSPIDSGFHEHDRNGLHHPYSHNGPTRYRSSSPKSRPPPPHVDSSSSSSETSTDEEVDQRWAARPQATPRQTRPQPASSDFGGRTSANGPSLTGQFPGTAYVKPPTPREAESGRHSYRPDPPPRNQPVSQAAFSYVPGYSEKRPTAQPVPGVGNGYAGPGAPANGPNMYAPSHFYPREWSRGLRSSPSRNGKSVPSLNGFPSWAVPSSVLPRKDTPKKHTLDTIREEKRDWIESWRSDASRSTFIKRLRKHGRFADSAMPDSSSSETDTPKPRAPRTFHSASQEDVSKKFSTSEWEDKFASAEDIFRPTPSETHPKRSPVRPQRPRAKSHSKSRTSPIRESSNEFPTGKNSVVGEDSGTSEAFVPGKFSTEEWAEKLKFRATTGSHEDDRTKTFKYEFKVPAPKQQPFSSKPGSPAIDNGASDRSVNEASGAGMKLNDDVDPMDLDDSFPSSVPSTPSEVKGSAAKLQHTRTERGEALGADISCLDPVHTATGDVNLSDLSNVAPFKPSDTGLGDLKDFSTTLPFESKASPARPSPVMSNGVAFSSLKALNLPKQPKDVIPPLETVTQEVWIRYTNEMSAYMHDWQVFNKKMLDHFAARQAQLDMTLMSNWMSALGDGPNAEEISSKIQDDPTISGGAQKAKAGYAAYRQWMEEDMRVREWWNVACERHRQAVIELGRVRDRAKLLAVV